VAFEVDPAARRLARLYALVHRGNAGDVDFYVRACAGAARVLELGCGTGRVLRAVAEVAGHVTGLDL
jgi:SAM-dependent methyltransferase